MRVSLQDPVKIFIDQNTDFAPNIEHEFIKLKRKEPLGSIRLPTASPETEDADSKDFLDLSDADTMPATEIIDVDERPYTSDAISVSEVHEVHSDDDDDDDDDNGENEKHGNSDPSVAKARATRGGQRHNNKSSFSHFPIDPDRDAIVACIILYSEFIVP